jgi:hypothetical protein
MPPMREGDILCALVPDAHSPNDSVVPTMVYGYVMGVNDGVVSLDVVTTFYHYCFNENEVQLSRNDVKVSTLELLSSVGLKADFPEQGPRTEARVLKMRADLDRHVSNLSAPLKVRFCFVHDADDQAQFNSDVPIATGGSSFSRSGPRHIRWCRCGQYFV